ncbi:MAG: PIN domain-containing protein [Longimicrobiales bacterium]
MPGALWPGRGVPWPSSFRRQGGGASARSRRSWRISRAWVPARRKRWAPTWTPLARLWAELAKRGELVGAHDLWLAATCVGRGLSLATGNVREFGRVPGLVVEDWSGGEREA